MNAVGLSVERVGFDYGAERPALSGVDVHVEEGELLVLLGPSGSGKSTLLRLVAGLDRPTAGRILLNGKPILQSGIERAVVFQHYALFQWYTVLENVALAVGQAHPRLVRKEKSHRAFACLEQVGLGDAAGKYPYELSGGMQQRAAIARALALESPVLLLDEPFGALDPVSRARLQDLLLDVSRRASPRRTVLFVTHDVEEALYLADRIVVLGSAPGPVVAEIPVPFARPRHRAALRADARYALLRERITERLDAEMLAALATEDR